MAGGEIEQPPVERYGYAVVDHSKFGSLLRPCESVRPIPQKRGAGWHYGLMAVAIYILMVAL